MRVIFKDKESLIVENVIIVGDKVKVTNSKGEIWWSGYKITELASIHPK